MKTLQKLVLIHLHLLVSSSMDQLQVTYEPGLRVDYYLPLKRSLSHLDKPGNTLRVILFDISRAFNTIRSGLLRHKVDPHPTVYIIDYLINSTSVRQYMWVRRGYLQHRNPTGNNYFSLPLHLLHRWHQIQLSHLPPSEVFWWLGDCQPHHWWGLQGLQGAHTGLCGPIPEEIPPVDCWENPGPDGELLQFTPSASLNIQGMETEIMDPYK